MPNYTQNYRFEKPLASELYDIATMNGNMDKVDTAIDEASKRVKPVSEGGTGATEALAALTNLGIRIQPTEPADGILWIKIPG